MLMEAYLEMPDNFCATDNTESNESPRDGVEYKEAPSAHCIDEVVFSSSHERSPSHHSPAHPTKQRPPAPLLSPSSCEDSSLTSSITSLEEPSFQGSNTSISSDDLSEIVPVDILKDQMMDDPGSLPSLLGVEKKTSFTTLRLTYLLVTLVVMLADGLQGMCNSCGSIVNLTGTWL